jgi:hypothetical protein
MPTVHHLFNFEDIHENITQPYICFLTDSPLFSYLQSNLQGREEESEDLPEWKHLTTEPVTGIEERITPQHPAYKERSRGFRLHAAGSDGESYSWSYMPRWRFAHLLQISYDGLIQMLDILRTDFPLLLSHRPTGEWTFMGAEVGISWEGSAAAKFHGKSEFPQITEDNFDYIVAHLRALSNAQLVTQGQPSSAGGYDFNRRPSKMAFQLLAANYGLDIHEICIV